MEEITKLAEYGPTGISIALILAIVYMGCKFIPLFVNSLNANTKATIEMHEFLKGLNGRLRQVVNEKLDENSK
jgi:hypothetical protein